MEFFDSPSRVAQRGEGGTKYNILRVPYVCLSEKSHHSFIDDAMLARSNGGVLGVAYLTARTKRFTAVKRFHDKALL